MCSETSQFRKTALGYLGMQYITLLLINVFIYARTATLSCCNEVSQMRRILEEEKKTKWRSFLQKNAAKLERGKKALKKSSVTLRQRVHRMKKKKTKKDTHHLTPRKSVANLMRSGGLSLGKTSKEYQTIFAFYRGGFKRDLSFRLRTEK